MAARQVRHTCHSCAIIASRAMRAAPTDSQKIEAMNHEETDSRITELEIQLAHMETIVTDLSDMIKSQWDRIDVLERQNKLMSTDIKRMIDFLRTAPEDDAPPPHY
jgi:SlyX protein